ncbi:hypothetical protein E8E12_000829 [Didymella heteroderae]|uniref:ZZ-type domain-containing protein n=1 Tax=Didymella heteroderae TaxID=1769908 RepID=A0A9P4WHP1_9PLEO|nr:hypothetical protein E8E12_000829 [Didymella heteroderae]
MSAPWSSYADPTCYTPSDWPSDKHSSQFYAQPSASNLSYGQPGPQYIQPLYGKVGRPTFVAELPAPLPVAPPTATPFKQLSEDEQLARKLSAPDRQALEDEELAKHLQQLEVQELRSRSNSNVSEQQRPVSVVSHTHKWTPSLAQQSSSQSLRPHSKSRSYQSLRPHSQSLSSDIPWSPGSFGPPPQTQQRYGLLPEAVLEQVPQLSPRRRPSAAMSNLPEVVISDISHPPKAPSDPIALATYLEEHRQVPYPPQWRLGPVIKRYHAQASITANLNWLDTPESTAWMTHRRSEKTPNSLHAALTFSFKRIGGKYRDPRFSWVMQSSDAESKTKTREPPWSYELRLDLKSGVRKTETLNPGSGKMNILTTYVHAPNYDSLRFVANDGKSYLWVSHMPLSSSNGRRYDVLRHALFVATGSNIDPLFGDIVADHTYWDGFDDDHGVHEGIMCMECQTKPIVGQRWRCRTCPDHNICGLCHLNGAQSSIEPGCVLSLTCLPDETLTIRSPIVSHALVIASLQVLKDWQKHQIRKYRSKDPWGFMQTEEEARKHYLGRLSYWRGSDIGKKHLDAPLRVRSRSETGEAMLNPNGIGTALGGLADAGLSLAARGQQGGYEGHPSGHQHYAYAGDGGGWGGGGDGGGGGG